MLQRQVQKGLALMDEAMLAVTAGELSPIMTGLRSSRQGCRF